VWLDATGVVKRQEIASDDWMAIRSGTAEKFIRTEIHAKASRPRLLHEFVTAVRGTGLAGSIGTDEMEEQPLLRALSNPIYVDP
jgi:hypothetical protein